MIPPPVKPSDRDPNHIFIGVPSIRDLPWNQQAILQLLQHATNPYTFTVMRCTANGQSDTRNTLTALARSTPASKMIQVDDDMVYTAHHFLRLASHDLDVVGAIYPKKQLPNVWSGEFYEGQENKVIRQVYGVGAGMICVTMSAIDKLVENYPWVYEDIHGNELHDLWGEGLFTNDWHEKGRVYTRRLADDYSFCHRWSEIGGTCWIDTHCQVGHLGTVNYMDLVQDVSTPSDEVQTLPR